MCRFGREAFQGKTGLGPQRLWRWTRLWKKFDPIRPFVLLTLFNVVATLVGPLTLQIFAVASAISNLAHNSSTINASLLKASLQNSPA